MFTIGIDFGTTNSAVAYVDEDGTCKLVAIDNDDYLLPSVIKYDCDSTTFGREALCSPEINNSVFSIKRQMGTNQKALNRSPEEIAADIFKHIKIQTEKTLNKTIDAAVITVPAHFSDAQRISITRAASIANIKILRIINEPTAAAIAFGIDTKPDGIYGVYDLGGGTFDFSILRLSSRVFQVLATGGDNLLGGDDIDEAIFVHNLKQHQIDAQSLSPKEFLLGKIICKHIKEELAHAQESSATAKIQDKEYQFTMDYNLLQSISKPYIRKSLAIVNQVFADANVNFNRVEGIVLVGGMTKLPFIQEMIAEEYGVRCFSDTNPDTSVAIGAAINAHSIISKEGTLLLDVVPLTLGIETFGGGVDKIIHRNTPIPIMQTREYTTYADNQVAIKFHVVQGERPLAKDCRSLSNFELSDIPPMPSGVARVIVEFCVDVNGLLSVKAHEKNTLVSQSITIEPSSGLTEDELISILESGLQNQKKDEEQSREITVIVETERAIRFWQSILEKLKDIDENAFQTVTTNISTIQSLMLKRDIKTVVEIKKTTENLVNKFLDEIIKATFLGRTISTAHRIL